MDTISNNVHETLRPYQEDLPDGADQVVREVIAGLELREAEIAHTLRLAALEAGLDSHDVQAAFEQAGLARSHDERRPDRDTQAKVAALFDDLDARVAEAKRLFGL